jgi:CheY-like chemotaxis protein
VADDNAFSLLILKNLFENISFDLENLREAITGHPSICTHPVQVVTLLNKLIGLGLNNKKFIKATTAKDGREALKKFVRNAEPLRLASEDPDTSIDSRFALVATDFNMPHLDGAQTTQRIVAMQVSMGGVYAPVFVQTSNSDTRTRAECIEAGAEVVLTKPLTMEKVKAMVCLYIFKLDWHFVNSMYGPII